MSSHDVDRFGEHRTGTEVDRLLHYGHVIPIGRGLTAAYVAKHFPGWTWNGLMGVWMAAGIVVGSSVGGPPRCDERVAAIHFDGTGRLPRAVDRRDGDDPVSTPDAGPSLFGQALDAHGRALIIDVHSNPRVQAVMLEVRRDTYLDEDGNQEDGNRDGAALRGIAERIPRIVACLAREPAGA